MATEETELQPEEKTKKQASGRQIAIIVGAAVLLLIVFWFVFLRGGGDDEATLSTPPEPTLTELPGNGNGKGGNGGNKPGDNGPVETTEVFASRDPFKPLLSVGDTGGSADTPTDTTGDPTTDTPTDTPTDGTTIIDPTAPPTTDPGTDGTPDGGGENVEGHTVELIGISGNGSNATAQIQVDDTIYTVEEGESFAENFKLLSTSNECATVLYRDDQFTVCEGEEILK